MRHDAREPYTLPMAHDFLAVRHDWGSGGVEMNGLPLVGPQQSGPYLGKSFP